MSRPLRPLGIVALVLLLAVALLLVPGPQGSLRRAAGVSLPCPGSVNVLGLVTVNVDCTILTNTIWGNGTLLLGGNLNVASGAELTLWNVALQFTPTFDEAFGAHLDGGRLVIRGGALGSSNANDHWYLETTTAPGALVDLQGTNVSSAGGASVSGFLLNAGTGHRFEHVAFSASAVGSDASTAVVRIAGPSVSDVRVENSTFTGTGCAYLVDSLVTASNLVFSGNRITGFTGNPSSSAAVAGGNTHILDNTVDAGSATGIQVSGGGPGYPAANAYRVSGNSITTTGNAIVTDNSHGYDIVGNRIVGGHVSLDGSGNRFAYNNVTGTDERVTPGAHVLWTSSNSSIDHNTFWNIGLTQDSVIVSFFLYGNVKVTDNTIYAGCYGNNCMGIETINVQGSQRTVFPGFPTVEVARNRVVWTTISSGGLTAAWDNEFSEREWIHDNVESVLPGAGVGTSSIEVGGAQASVFENNSILGPTTWCIYDYVYSDAGNLFQNNRCNDAQYGGIFQTGGNVFRNNVFTNLTSAGIWICPDSPCAGSDSQTTGNVWYNNTFTYVSPMQNYLTEMDLSNALNNSFIGHGASQWTDGAMAYPVYGEWLFFANRTITHLGWADGPGSRTLTMTAGARTSWDRENLAAIADRASLALDGAFDANGSLYGGTVLWSLNPSGISGLYVTGSGPVTLTLQGFLPNHTYNVTFEDQRTQAVTADTLTTDANGNAALPANFGPTDSPHVVLINANAPPPVGDTTPPAAITDLRVFLTGPDYVVLQWTTPGDNGMVGQASEFNLRENTTGPITNATFGTSVQVPTPPPGLPGSTVSLNVTGLTPNTAYWFAMTTADAVPNWSPMSNAVSTTTGPAGSGSTSPPLPTPSLSTVNFLSQANAIELVFSRPMNPASVNASIRISPQVPYRLDWLNDSAVRLTFLAALAPGTTYTLTVTRSALDTQGYALPSAFTYQFSAAGPTSPPSSALPIRLPGGPWPLAAAALIAATLLAILASLGSAGATRRERDRILGRRQDGDASTTTESVEPRTPSPTRKSARQKRVGGAASSDKAEERGRD